MFFTGVCSIITVKGARPGSSLLKVTYATSRGDVLSATVAIATYLPLTLTYPSHTPILTLGEFFTVCETVISFNNMLTIFCRL